MPKLLKKIRTLKIRYGRISILSSLSKRYGNIEKEYELLHINQLIKDSYSRYNHNFKEYIYYNNHEEYLLDYNHSNVYKKKATQLIKYCSEYNHFFCLPKFRDKIVSDIMDKNSDEKAKLYCEENFDNVNSFAKNKKKESSFFSSLDNITDNKIIFSKKTKKFIETEMDEKNITISLTTNSHRNDNNHQELLISKNENDSFQSIVKNLINYPKTKKQIIKQKVGDVKSQKIISEKRIKKNDFIRNRKKKTPNDSRNKNLKKNLSFFSLIKNATRIKSNLIKNNHELEKRNKNGFSKHCKSSNLDKYWEMISIKRHKNINNLNRSIIPKFYTIYINKLTKKNIKIKKMNLKNIKNILTLNNKKSINRFYKSQTNSNSYNMFKDFTPDCTKKK